MSESHQQQEPKPPYVVTERQMKDLEQHAHPSQANLPQQPGGGGAPGTGTAGEVQDDLQMSEEASNQQRTGEKKVTERGTP